jgi:hypothetical protein
MDELAFIHGKAWETWPYSILGLEKVLDSTLLYFGDLSFFWGEKSRDLGVRRRTSV